MKLFKPKQSSLLEPFARYNTLDSPACWKTEFFLVLQMMRSAHWTTTMDTKKEVWQVYSRIFLSLKRTDLLKGTVSCPVLGNRSLAHRSFPLFSKERLSNRLLICSFKKSE